MGDAHPQKVPLPPSVEELIIRICTAQTKPPLNERARSTLASLGEEAALDILRKISAQVIRKTFDGFVMHMAKQLTVSPNKRVCLSPPLQQQNWSSTPTRTLTPTRLMMNSSCDSVAQCPMTPIQMHLEGSCSSSREATRPGISPQLEALGELEFRKAFLILSYIGGKRLEEVMSADEIRSRKHLPMYRFEQEIWKAVGDKCGDINEKNRVKPLHWDSGKTHVYHCHVDPVGSYRFKGPYLTIGRNFLQRSLGDDNVLMVKFAEEVTEQSMSSGDYYAKYNKVAREGILVGLRRYRFFVFKDGGKQEKKKDPTTSPVKCFFVCIESDASIDSQDYILRGKTIREARSVFMNVDSLPSLSKYMARFSLILSKTMKVDIDLTSVDIQWIEDTPCRDKNDKIVHDNEGEPLIHTDGTGFISGDLALKCPKNVHNGNCTNADNVEPLLIQCRLFHNGRAVKGTLLVNKQLPAQTINVRRSMIKVKPVAKLSSTSTVNSLEIVTTSNRPRKTCLSRHLIALLSHGGVPQEFFMELLTNSLEDARGALSSESAALRVAQNRGDTDVLNMILSGIPLEESFLQHRLSRLMREEKQSLRGGKIPVPESFYLMGTADPTGLLKRDEVCIILDNGHVSGKVLVYRNPGLHFGDIHILNATYVEALKDFVGNAKYAIFFPCKGPRSLADEMAGGDYDGDMYFVSRNPQLLEYFKQSEPWASSSSANNNISDKKPSELSDEQLEDELFGLFLANRFQASYTVGIAAESWLALMDRFLTLRDDSSNEKNILKKNILQLIDIYYDALDAPKKSGIKVEVPKELRAELLPHYFERNADISYKSTSILGLIYDKVKSYEQEDNATIEVQKLPSFDVEVPQSCRTKWEKLYEEYRQDMASALRLSKESEDAAADEVMKKYKQILYEAGEFHLSERRKRDIYDEAIAIYQIAYEYAKYHGAEKCWFVWKVAGSALCELHILNRCERPMLCSPSLLKIIASLSQQLSMVESSVQQSTFQCNSIYDYKGESIYCYCGIKAPRYMSMSDMNPGRRFYGCSNYKTTSCGFFRWHDPELDGWFKQVMTDLIKENKKLKEENIQLKNENAKLRLTNHVGVNYDVHDVHLAEQVRTLRSDIENLNDTLERQVIMSTAKSKWGLCAKATLLSLLTTILGIMYLMSL